MRSARHPRRRSALDAGPRCASEHAACRKKRNALDPTGATMILSSRATRGVLVKSPSFVRRRAIAIPRPLRSATMVVLPLRSAVRLPESGLHQKRHGSSKQAIKQDGFLESEKTNGSPELQSCTHSSVLPMLHYLPSAGRVGQNCLYQWFPESLVFTILRSSSPGKDLSRSPAWWHVRQRQKGRARSDSVVSLLVVPPINAHG